MSDAPFYVDPFIGYKGFVFGRSTIRGEPALQPTVRRDTIWYPPDRTSPEFVDVNLLKAQCIRPVYTSRHLRGVPAPDARCDCGLWAYRDMAGPRQDAFMRMIFNPPEYVVTPTNSNPVLSAAVLAVVWCWGKMFVNEISMRSEYMRIAALCTTTAYTHHRTAADLIEQARFAEVARTLNVDLVSLRDLEEYSRSLPGILPVPGKEY